MAIIYKPIITEKSNLDSELNGRYSFFVNPSANKIEIKKAVEEFYGVSVNRVRTMNYTGKIKSRYTRAGTEKGRRPHTKKAILELSKGQEIDLYGDI